MLRGYWTISILLLGVVISVGGINAQERSGNKVLRAGVNGMGSPKCVYCPAPDYSDEARAAKYSGTVLLDVTVTAAGKVVDSIVLRSPGLGLDKKALQQVATWLTGQKCVPLLRVSNFLNSDTH